MIFSVPNINILYMDYHTSKSLEELWEKVSLLVETVVYM
jgi:hypothetical protein